MSAISGLYSNGASSGDALGALSSDEFLRIIFTELQNQDPLEPQDTGATLEQLATLRSIESDTQMVNSLETLVRQSEFASASNLIGNLVSGITIDNSRVADLVISVTQTSQGPLLNLFDGSRMFFDQVDEIIGPLENTDPVDDTDDPDDPDDVDDDDGTDDVDDTDDTDDTDDGDDTP
jgi:flagellar basal-body rod modification protein FlgD